MEGMERLDMDLDFYRGRRILITGHTGFKGSWMCRLLLEVGADLTGYSLTPPTDPALFTILGLQNKMRSIIGDIRNFQNLQSVFAQMQPEIVFHLAAQPIVRESYKSPHDTYETNVMGTVNLLECVRTSSSVRSVVNVTTDKVYLNREWIWGYREDDMLDGYDPYSNSKSCSELVTHSYIRSFFQAESAPSISTVRAGNVIGGGDFACDRIIPDCIRAVLSGKEIIVRNPSSIRPYQHVLEPVMAYLMIAERQYSDGFFSDCYNVGPDDCDCVTTGELVDTFTTTWGNGAQWVNASESNSPHEASFLKLDCSKLKHRFGWRPKWHIAEAVKKTCEWIKVWCSGGDLDYEMHRQIIEFLN